MHRERHRAHRLDAFGQQRRPDLRLERHEIRALEPSRLPGREGHPRRRPGDGDEHVLLDEPLALELDRPHVEGFPVGVVHGEARVIVGDDAPETGRDRAEERAPVEVRDERIVDVEQQLEAVALPRELVLRLLGRLVVERVVDGQRYLARELVQDLDVGVGEGVFVLAREAEAAETAERGREREDAERPHALGLEDPRDLAKAWLLVDARHDERPLRLPHEARGRVGDGQLERGEIGGSY